MRDGVRSVERTWTVARALCGTKHVRQFNNKITEGN